MSCKVLVTGGAGFLGSHLCRMLLQRGNHVIAVDNLCTGSRRRISDCLSNKRFQFIEHDVCNPLNFESVDQIYNLACPASPVKYQSMPIETLKTSVVGAINVLDFAVKSGAAVLQASTSEVYGDPLQHPQHESYCGNVNTVGLRACYDEGKRCAETVFFDYHRQHGVTIKIARIFNTYGPCMSVGDGRVISNFVVQALEGKPLTVYGDGSQTRSFCYVDDMVAGLICLMEHPGSCVGPVNLGNSEEVSLLDLVDLMKKLFGRNLKTVFASLPQDDPVRRCPDISLAKKLFNWNPRVSLASGLERTICYFASRLNDKVAERLHGV